MKDVKIEIYYNYNQVDFYIGRKCVSILRRTERKNLSLFSGSVEDIVYLYTQENNDMLDYYQFLLKEIKDLYIEIPIR